MAETKLSAAQEKKQQANIAARKAAAQQAKISNPRTVNAPAAAPHVVAQPPGLHSPALEFQGGHYVLPRTPAHHVAWEMDQLPYLGVEEAFYDGGPVTPG